MSIADSVETIVRAHRAGPDALIVLVGPTASGKTELSLALAAALDGEIVNADSVQIVRGFDVGSGKPTHDERARAPHHLFDAIAPDEDIDAAEYARRAEQVIAEIRARGRVPLVVGGTFFWVRALTLGLIETPPADANLRRAHEELVAREGALALHAELARVDAEAAARLHANDVVRVSRALEVFALTGRTQSELYAEHAFRHARHPALLFGRSSASEELDRRIEARAAAWLARGWKEEVAQLCREGYAETRAMGSVGYKEVRAHLDGALPEAELLPSIVRATRVFARRQRTWLRKAEVKWL